MERELYELDALGDVLRSEDDVAVVAVAATASRLEVVALAPRHVEDDERQLRESDLGERLLHQRQPLTGRACGRAHAGGQRAPRHAYSLELRLGVYADTAFLGQQPREVFEQLGERSHRVPGEEPAPGRDRRPRQR